MNFKLTASLIAKDRCFFFQTGAQPPHEDFRHDYGLTLPLDSFPPGKWTHVALTWDRQTGNKAVYLNGTLAAHNNTRLIPSGPGCERLRIGARTTN